MRCHFTPVLNGYHPKDKKEQVLVRMWRKENPCALLVGMENGIFIKGQFGSPSKIIENIRSKNHCFECMLKGDKTRMSRRFLQSHIH